MNNRIAAFLLITICALAHSRPGHPLESEVPPQAKVPGDVMAFTEAFQHAVRTYDVQAWTALVSEEIVMMAPNGRVVEGRQAFQSLWSRSFEGASGPNPLSLRLRGIHNSGDLVAVRVDYGPKNADPVGQYVWILQRKAEQGLILEWWIFTGGG